MFVGMPISDWRLPLFSEMLLIFNRQVSLFAEMFNEMLMRDFGFRIYKSLVAAPQRAVEEDKKDSDKSKEGAEKDDKESTMDKTKKEEVVDKEKLAKKIESEVCVDSASFDLVPNTVETEYNDDLIEFCRILVNIVAY